MSFLSNLFNSDDSDSTNADSSDLMSDIDAVVGLDFSHESYSQETDEDGSSSTNADSTDFGTDVDLGSMLHSITDSFNDTSEG
jgi:hypothetical protein